MEQLTQQQYDSLTIDQRIAHAYKGTRIIHAADILCTIAVEEENGRRQAKLHYLAGQRYPHNLADKAYDFFHHFPNLDPNILHDLLDIKEAFARWDTTIDQGKMMTYSNTQTMGAISSLFNLLLYSRQESNGQQFNYIEVLKERMNEVYDNDSEISRHLKQFRRSTAASFILSRVKPGSIRTLVGDDATSCNDDRE